MASPRFTGVMTALVTPFHDDGALDLASYRNLIEDQIKNGIQGLVPCGTTGEASTMTQEEHVLVVKTCKEAVAGRVPVIAGAGANDTKRAIELQQKMAALGVDATLQVTPWYNKPTQEGLYRHFKAIAESTPSLPIILYNVPGRTGVDMLPETIVRLAKDVKNIVAVKEATGSVQRAQEILNKLHAPGVNRDDFTILSGDDGFILGLLGIGGHGVISVTSHVCAKELVQMTKAFHDGKHAEAQALSRKTSPLVNALFFRTSPIPVKTALAWRTGAASLGIKPNFRSPLCPLDDAEQTQLRKMLEGWL